MPRLAVCNVTPDNNRTVLNPVVVCLITVAPALAESLGVHVPLGVLKCLTATR
jgi:hypothetical protein